MNLQYFYMYSLNETTSIGAAPNIIANWEQTSGNKWTVPIGLGISRTFQFGKVPVGRRIMVFSKPGYAQRSRTAGPWWAGTRSTASRTCASWPTT